MLRLEGIDAFYGDLPALSEVSLEVREKDDGHEVADGQRVGGGVKAGVSPAGAGCEVRPQSSFVGRLVEQPPPAEFVDEVDHVLPSVDGVGMATQKARRPGTCPGVLMVVLADVSSGPG